MFQLQILKNIDAHQSKSNKILVSVNSKNLENNLKTVTWL